MNRALQQSKVMRMKIGVIGSGESPKPKLAYKARRVGEEIARAGCILLTGSGLGVSYEAVKGAKEAGGFTVGFSPASGLREHEKTYGFPTELFDILVFTGFGLKGRNVLFVRTCDGVISISGRIGTLNELTIAFDEHKAIGILSGSGGVSDIFHDLAARTGKRGSRVVEDEDPRALVSKVMDTIKRRWNSRARSSRARAKD